MSGWVGGLSRGREEGRCMVGVEELVGGRARGLGFRFFLRGERG